MGGATYEAKDFHQIDLKSYPQLHLRAFGELTKPQQGHSIKAPVIILSCLTTAKGSVRPKAREKYKQLLPC